MIVFFDIGLILLFILLFFSIIGGSAYAIVDFLQQHLLMICIICFIVIALMFVIFYFTVKRWKTAFISIIYTSQLCFFVVYGIYQLGLLYGPHPIKCVLLFFVYAVYAVLNSIGLAILYFYCEEEKYEIQSKLITNKEIGMILLGLAGWFINYIFLPI